MVRRQPIRELAERLAQQLRFPPSGSPVNGLPIGVCAPLIGNEHGVCRHETARGKQARRVAGRDEIVGRVTRFESDTQPAREIRGPRRVDRAALHIVLGHGEERTPCQGLVAEPGRLVLQVRSAEAGTASRASAADARRTSASRFSIRLTGGCAHARPAQWLTRRHRLPAAQIRSVGLPDRTFLLRRDPRASSACRSRATRSAPDSRSSSSRRCRVRR